MDMAMKSLFEEKPFLHHRAERERRLLDELNKAFEHHTRHSALYARICESSGWSPEAPATRLDELPTSYTRYLINGIRRELGFGAVPVRLNLRSAANPFDKKK